MQRTSEVRCTWSPDQEKDWTPIQFTAFGLPLIAVLIFLGASVLKSDALGALTTGVPDKSELQVEGYVDHSRLINVIPEDIPSNILVAYPDEASARQALNDGFDDPIIAFEAEMR